MMIIFLFSKLDWSPRLPVIHIIRPEFRPVARSASKILVLPKGLKGGNWLWTKVINRVYGLCVGTLFWKCQDFQTLVSRWRQMWSRKPYWVISMHSIYNFTCIICIPQHVCPNSKLSQVYFSWWQIPDILGILVFRCDIISNTYHAWQMLELISRLVQ